MPTSPAFRAPATWALVCVSLVLSACATRNPAPDATASTSPPATAASGASTGTAGAAGASGRDAGSGAGRATAGGATASAPRDTSVYFEFDSSTLSPDARTLVQQHADFLAGRRHPVRLEGNTDERGSREYNLALGHRRAESVRQLLTLRGLPGDGVEAVSYGEERPRCSEDDEQCFAANRRVDFIYPR